MVANQPNFTAKMAINAMATRNVGVASIANWVPLRVRSSHEPGRSALSTAIGMASASAISCDSSTSSRVTPMRWPRASATGWRVRYEMPRSPVTAPPTQRA